MTGEPQPKYTLILARIGGLLGLPLQTVCTSMLVFHRRKVNPDVQITAEMLVACLSASMKTHENSKKLRDILECTHSVLGIPTDKVLVLLILGIALLISRYLKAVIQVLVI